MEENNKKKKHGTLILSIIELIIIIGLVVFMVYFNNTSKKDNKNTIEKTTKVETKDNKKAEKQEINLEDNDAEKLVDGVNYLDFTSTAPYQENNKNLNYNKKLDFNGKKIDIKFYNGNDRDWGFSVNYGNKSILKNADSLRFFKIYIMDNNYLVIKTYGWVNPFLGIYDKNLNLVYEEKDGSIVDSFYVNDSKYNLSNNEDNKKIFYGVCSSNNEDVNNPSDNQKYTEYGLFFENNKYNKVKIGETNNSVYCTQNK